MSDIRRDFAKFVKDFPIGIIPHTSDEELQQRNLKHKQSMMAAIRRNPRLPNARINDLEHISAYGESQAKEGRASQSQMTRAGMSVMDNG